ncbi:MAG TPA: LLM class flavin-dependent oxidoreductase [Allosphingosinicella sp.]|nr:LLM class flavin-dependent oxidoreductase [Allosphingosinicella sp.]
MGIQLPTKASSWEVVVRAEQLGYSHAWFFDTALLNAEMFAAMGAAAVKTSKIKLCTGVMVPSNRIAPVAASGLATLNALAPGRIVFGVSTGFSARRAMGLEPVTLARLSKYIEDVQTLLAGEMIELEIEGGVHKTRFLNPEPELINIKDPIPLALSAFGPKGRALVAKYGAHWIGLPTTPEREQAEMAEIRSRWAEAGREPGDLYTIANVGGCVLDDGELPDSPRAMAQAGPFAAVMFHDTVEREEFGSVLPGEFPFPAELEAYRKVYQSYEPADARYLSNHRQHLMRIRPEEKHITGNIIKGFTLTGTKAELVERLKGLKECGFNQIQFIIVPGQENEMMERWAEVIAQV